MAILLRSHTYWSSHKCQQHSLTLICFWVRQKSISLLYFVPYVLLTGSAQTVLVVLCYILQSQLLYCFVFRVTTSKHICPGKIRVTKLGTGVCISNPFPLSCLTLPHTLWHKTHTERTVTPTSRPMAIAESTKITNIAAMTVRVLNSIGWSYGEWKNSSSARVTAKIWGMERDQGFRGKCCPTLCQNIGTGRTPAEILVKRRKCCMAGNSVFIPWNVVHLSGCSSVTSWSFREKLIFSVET